MNLEKLCERGKIGNLEIRNRMILAPMGVSLCEEGGFAGERIRKYPGKGYLLVHGVTGY